MRIPVDLLLDSGAGGGNYASESLWNSLCRRHPSFHAKLLDSRGRGALRAANPTEQKVPPMVIIGSCRLPLVFPPEDKVWRVLFRVVRGLPYGLILGAGFFHAHASTLCYAPGKGFRPGRSSKWVPFRTYPEHHTVTTLSSTWSAQSEAVRFRRRHRGHPRPPSSVPEPGSWENFCAVRPLLTEPERSIRDDLSWESDPTLEWAVSLAEPVQLDGFVSEVRQGFVRGPLPQHRQLVIMDPVEQFDMSKGATLGCARGAQWWAPGTPLLCKMVNTSKAPAVAQAGRVVARAIALEVRDKERLQKLFISSEGRRITHPPPGPQCRQAGQSGTVGSSLMVDTEGSGQREDTAYARVRDANCGQLTAEEKKQLTQVLEKFCNLGLFPTDPKLVPPCKAGKLSIPFTSDTCAPIATKQRRYSKEEQEMIRLEIAKLHERGIIRPSHSAFAAACVCIRKKDGTLRLCQDYRRLNAIIATDSGGLGDILSIFDRVKGSGYYSSIDLASGYFQLEIEERDKHKTAFRDADGQLWEYNRAGFGLKTLPAVFTNLVVRALGPLKGQGAESWMDDILVHSVTFEEHLSLIANVLQRFHDFGLSVNLAKSVWCAPMQEFVGMVVDRHGLRPAPSKVDAIAQLSTPTTVGQLRTFLGMTGYLRQFVPNYSTVATPLTNLLRNKRFATRQASTFPLLWGEEQQQAFDQLKKALMTPPILALPDLDQPFSLHVDASLEGAGAALTQSSEDGEQVVAYASHRWSKSDERRSATERECVGVLWAIARFRPYIWGRRFTLVTDCSALTWLFRSQDLSPKLHRWALRLMEYDAELKWKPGSAHQGGGATTSFRSAEEGADDTAHPGLTGSGPTLQPSCGRESRGRGGCSYAVFRGW